MIPWKNPGWSDGEDRAKNLDPSVDLSGTARFGLEEMPTGNKEKAVYEHFERVAPRYDFMNTVLSFGIHYAWKRKAVRMLDIRPGQMILDVCGGTGDLAVYCARRLGTDGMVVLYDINRAMLEHGIRRPENRLHRNVIDYIQGDAEAVCFPDNSFDIAVVGFGIRNLTRLRRGFSEMHRVLKPGGKMMCLEFSRPHNPVFRRLYDFYSFVVMPLAGGLLAGSSRSYACLSETIRMFPTPGELCDILEEIGYQDVSYTLLTDGIAAIHLGRKPEA